MTLEIFLGILFTFTEHSMAVGIHRIVVFADTAKRAENRQSTLLSDFEFNNVLSPPPPEKLTLIASTYCVHGDL